MKLKALLVVVSGLLSLPLFGATMTVNNLVAGPGDTLYANSANAPMTGGIVTMGYFSAGVAPTTISELISSLDSYTLVASGVPGVSSVFGPAPGYADSPRTTVLGGPVTAGNDLLGRSIYSIVTNAASLAAVTATSEFALVLIGPFTDDVPFEKDYFSNPGAEGVDIVIGTIDTLSTTTPAGAGTYGTLRMEVIPEPSTALLGALGAFALLRRRRD